MKLLTRPAAGLRPLWSTRTKNFLREHLRTTRTLASTTTSTTTAAAADATTSATTTTGSSRSTAIRRGGGGAPLVHLRVDRAVEEALRRGQPVVALESTLVAHGMPYPENLGLSQRVAAMLRQRGVEPATIGAYTMCLRACVRACNATVFVAYYFLLFVLLRDIFGSECILIYFARMPLLLLLYIHTYCTAVKDGVCRVGLTAAELEDLAQAGEQGRATKCSTRELSLLLSSQKKRNDNNNADAESEEPSQWGATTVASTMKLAHLAGIDTFVTGGVGGVHRHGEVSMDISADLTELSRTPVVVVSAGIKSILDIPRTLEVLETNGVPTVAYQTNEFPAFFSPHSGVPAPARVESAEQVAAAFLAAQELGLSHGMLVAVPNQDPAGAQVEDAIQSALTEAEDQGIRGQAVTPFVLKRVAEKTAGESLRSNMALVEQNAMVGAEIAKAISQQRSMRDSVQVPSTGVPQSRVIVMGGVVLDLLAKPKEGCKLILGTSNPAICKESDGGVARNIAEVLSRLGSNPLLYSVVGNDSRGNSMLNRLSTEYGIQATKDTVSVVNNANTATYIAVMNEKGDLHTACADMAVFDEFQPPPQKVLEQAEYLVLDANPPVSIMHQTALYASRAGVKVFLEPTSVAKALAVSKDDSLMRCLTFASPNVDELSAMADGWSNTADDHDVLLYDADLSLVKPLAEKVIKRMNPDGAYLLITAGAKGCLLASKEKNSNEISFQRFPAKEALAVKNATGAGDTLAGAFVNALLNGKSIEEACCVGIEASTLSLQCSESAISPLISDLAK